MKISRLPKSLSVKIVLICLATQAANACRSGGLSERRKVMQDDSELCVCGHARYDHSYRHDYSHCFILKCECSAYTRPPEQRNGADASGQNSAFIPGDTCGNCHQACPCFCDDPHPVCGICGESLSLECRCTEREFATPPRSNRP